MQTFEYKVIRYRSDKDEQINIGIMIHELSTGNIHTKISKCIKKTKLLTRDFHKKSWVKLLYDIEESLNKYDNINKVPQDYNKEDILTSIFNKVIIGSDNSIISKDTEKSILPEHMDTLAFMYESFRL